MPLYNVNVFWTMQNWIIFFCCFCIVTITGKPTDDSAEEYCQAIKCVGVEYECVDGRCYCAPGYIPNHFQVRCVKCPDIGEKCFGQCCNLYSNESLHCWQGICQPCHDAYGNWACRENMKDILLISSAQIAMGAALVFGIIATFILLYKLCAATNLRPLGNRSNAPARLSIGSLQVYVDERLRDAPPQYTRQPASGSAIYPAIAYLNNGFVHDSSIPPPPYSPEDKPEENLQTRPNLHI